LIPSELLDRSGSVFFSGRTAFTGPSDMYILGLNPGGPPQEGRPDRTVRWHTDHVLSHTSPNWSAYRDEPWGNDTPGTWGMQPRVLHLFNRLDLDPGRVPASNLVFLRSAREKDISSKFRELAEICWPFHQAVIASLNVRVVVCFGKRAGNWVRRRLNATTLIGQFVEVNKRRWTSDSFTSEAGLGVVVLTHPSIADWTTSAADPTSLVAKMIGRAPSG